MTTDITELAQREKFEAWVVTQIWVSKSTLEGMRTADGYRNSTISGRDYDLMWDCWKAANSELVEALEKRIAELESRTVTINVPDARDDDYDWEGQTPSEAFNACRMICTLMFRQSLRAAGIKWEAE